MKEIIFDPGDPVPYGYTIDQELNRFYFEITGEQQIAYTQGNKHNSAGTFPAAEDSPHIFRAYNEPWKIRWRLTRWMKTPESACPAWKFDILRFNRDTKITSWIPSYQPEGVEVAEQADGTYLSGWVYWNEQQPGKVLPGGDPGRRGYFGDWLDRLAEAYHGASGRLAG